MCDAAQERSIAGREAEVAVGVDAQVGDARRALDAREEGLLAWEQGLAAREVGVAAAEEKLRGQGRAIDARIEDLEKAARFLEERQLEARRGGEGGFVAARQPLAQQ